MGASNGRLTVQKMEDRTFPKEKDLRANLLGASNDTAWRFIKCSCREIGLDFRFPQSE